MSKISPSSASSTNPASGATDSPWRPSWLHWLISALSGTVEIEKQTAWLKQENARLAEIDAKYDALRRKSATNSTPPTTTDEH